MATVASCTDDYTDWDNPQKNAEEAAKTMEVKMGAAEAIDFAKLEGVDSVQVFTSSITGTDSPVMNYVLRLTNPAAADKVAQIEANQSCKVAVADLKAAVESLYGKAPMQRTISTAISAYATVKGEAYKYTGDTEIKATLVAPNIETAYYIVGDGLGWDYAGAAAHKFYHSTTNVYDDPVFTITVPAPTNDDGSRKDFYFKIFPQSGVDAATKSLDWSKVLGTDQDTEDVRAEEMLKTDGKAFKQSASDGAKFYTITLNMMDGKMTVAPLAFEEYIYVPGNHQGWKPESAPALRSPGFDGIYEGFVHLDGEFKFTKKRNWNDGEYNFESFSSVGSFTQGGGTNLNGTEGHYFIKADIPGKTLSATPITKVGMIGSFTNGWSDADEVAMTYVAAEDCWTATVTLDGGKFKFRFNGKWADDLNLGGSLDNLVRNGDDLTAPAGTYTVKLYMSRSQSNNIYCTLTK